MDKNKAERSRAIRSERSGVEREEWHGERVRGDIDFRERQVAKRLRGEVMQQFDEK